jgi:hypothetical protein
LRDTTEILEPEDFTQPFSVSQTGSFTITFKGYKDGFRSLYGWEAFLHQELRQMAQQQWRDLADSVGTAPLVLNVRLAKDFPAARPRDLVAPQGPVRTPLGWYVASLNAIRAAAGYPVRAIIVSDGSPDDLRELLECGHISLLRPGCAISDLLVLAQARLLIAAGGSSFSAWGAFLGTMPTISLPGQPLTWFGLRSTEHRYIGVFDPISPDEDLLGRAREVLTQAM